VTAPSEEPRECPHANCVIAEIEVTMTRDECDPSIAVFCDDCMTVVKHLHLGDPYDFAPPRPSREGERIGKPAASEGGA